MNPPGERSARLQRVLPAIFFMAAPAILILIVVRPGTFLFGYDIRNTFYALRGAAGHAFAGGRLPVWDPTVTCGAPLLAAMQSALLYPPTWVAAILSPGAFWNFTVALHLSLSGLFAFAWLTRGLGLGRAGSLVGAGLFMLSGYAITHVHGGHLTLISAYPWTAALLWRLERFLAAATPARGAKLAACLAMMILAGFPQLVLIAGLAWGARLVHHVLEERDGRGPRARRAGGTVAVLMAGVVLAAPQLLPTLELVGESQRSSVNTLQFATTYSLPPENLVTFLAPTFFGDSRSVPYWGRWYLWEISGFVGISALALAALGMSSRHRQRFLWLGVAVAGLLLALGRHTPLFDLFYLVMPGASLFRGPGRYLLLFTLATAPLAAMGFDRLASGEAREFARRLGIGVGILFVVVAGSGVLLSSADVRGFWKDVLTHEAAAARGIREEAGLSSESFPAASQAGAVRSLGWSSATLAAIAALLLLHRRGTLEGPRCAAALGLLAGVELLAFGARYFVGQSDRDLQWPPEFVARVRSHPQFPYRMATVFMGQTGEIGKCQLAGLDHVGGYDPLMLRRYVELLNVSQGAPADATLTAMIPGRTGPVMDLLGVREWILPGARRTIPRWKEVGPIGAATIYENPDALPRAFLVHRSRVIGPPEERLKYLTGPSFQPGREVVLESGSDESFDAGNDRVRILSAEPGSYRLQVENSGPGWLVLAEAFYPGWKAEVDGAAAEIRTADHMVQAIRLAGGLHVVQFTYRSTYLMPGFILALLTAALPFGIRQAARARSRR